MSKCKCSKDFPEEPFAMLSGKTRGLMYAQPGKLEFKRTLLLFLYIERRCVNGRRSALLAGT